MWFLLACIALAQDLELDDDTVDTSFLEESAPAPESALTPEQRARLADRDAYRAGVCLVLDAWVVRRKSLNAVLGQQATVASPSNEPATVAAWAVFIGSRPDNLANLRLLEGGPAPLARTQNAELSPHEHAIVAHEWVMVNGDGELMTAAQLEARGVGGEGSKRTLLRGAQTALPREQAEWHCDDRNEALRAELGLNDEDARFVHDSLLRQRPGPAWSQSKRDLRVE